MKEFSTSLRTSKNGAIPARKLCISARKSVVSMQYFVETSKIKNSKSVSLESTLKKPDSEFPAQANSIYGQCIEHAIEWRLDPERTQKFHKVFFMSSNLKKTEIIL